MARRGRECVVAECSRTAAVGSVVCTEHRDTSLGEQTDREIIKLTQRLDAMAKYEDGEEKREANREFRRQVARGDYAALFSTEMITALNEEGGGYGLKQEIGMMRVAMLRLLLEEESPSRMAHALAKLSGSLGKAMERQEVWDKAARQQRSYETYRDASLGKTTPMVDVSTEETVIEAPARVVAEVEVLDARDSVETDEMGESEMEEPFMGVDGARTGSSDYHMDVEEFAKLRGYGRAAGAEGIHG